MREDSESSMAMPKMSKPPGQGNITDSYQVQRGDTLTKIASRRLPPGASPAELQAAIAQIAKENGISDPNRIQAGATLKMPPNAGMGPAPGSAPPSAPPIDSSLAGAPSPMPSAPPPIPSAPLSPTGMRGTAIPQSIPMPMPSTGGGMGPSITPPTADQIKMSSMSAPGSLAPASQRGGFSFSESQVEPYQPTDTEQALAYVQQFAMNGDMDKLKMIAQYSDNPEIRKAAEFRLRMGPEGQKILSSRSEGPLDMPPPGRAGFKNTYRE